MRILADENVPRAVIAALREDQHDILWVRDVAPGMDDAEVLAVAQQQRRILITFDKDFGELAFSARLPAETGIILFRISMTSAQEVATTVTLALRVRDDWAGHFSVVEDQRIRMTSLPD